MTGDDLLRVYFDPDEIGPDGYPWVWHGPHTAGPGGDVAVKDLIRERAGNRCERCGHPYEKGMGEWSPCDEWCTHAGPFAMIEHLSRAGPLAREADAGMSIMQAREAAQTHSLILLAQWRILTVHHLNGVKHDLRWWNLAALCQRCHLTIQAKVYLERPWDKPHTEWFRPHAAGYYSSVLAENEGRPEPPREYVLEPDRMRAILAMHATQGTLL